MPCDFRLDVLLSDAAQALEDSGFSGLSEAVRLARARLEGAPEPPLSALTLVDPDEAAVASPTELELVTRLGVAGAHALRENRPGHRLIADLHAIAHGHAFVTFEKAPALVQTVTRAVEGLVASTRVDRIGTFESPDTTQPTAIGLARACPDPSVAYVAHVTNLHRAAVRTRALLGVAG